MRLVERARHFAAGEHEAIVDEALWTNVQAILSENRVDRANGTTGKEPNLLTRDFVRCARRPDEPDACEQKGGSLPVLHLAVIAGRIGESQERRPTNSGDCP